MTFGHAEILPGSRRVQIQWGDTLQRLALRELGDAALWARIVAINNLTPPYVTGDRALARPGVLLYGDTLLVPAPTADVSPGATWAEDVFLADVALPAGLLQVADGDLRVVGGHENLRQALGIRIRTEPGELVFHGDYGCRVHEEKGRRNTPVAALLSRAFVRDAVLDDQRVARILSASATVSGDVISVAVSAETVSGHPVDVTARV